MASSATDKRQLRMIIDQKLVQSGEKDKLKELLRHNLIQCGWRDDLKQHVKEIVKSKGLEHVTVDELVEEITPKGRSMVPDSIKQDLLDKIRKFILDSELK